ncbi:methyl-accepting chemotaxis protein [Spirilliplanes yamanashiensis]|uniref:Methyl-accepting chemotaxis protein n=1 Tax=Spirilliplanes yamanashiensis TaxID=42233 RepID=A0A8J3Y927_9ACTN|nr:methyl-accepting chemotaxis protein [Spirilliplanes yamanashiensis]MDP9815500.1 methyl-accepting chemotaxis protein [Spirilliplanes yamanashiensis]GIJ03754.1 hypothetical protein Sya03_31060 [Spirilliplanes yamanashiensis]
MSTSVPTRGRWSFRDLGVSAKILTAVAIAAVVALAVGLTGLVALSSVSDAAQRIYASNVASTEAVGKIRSSILQLRLDVGNHALAPDAAVKARYRNAVTEEIRTAEAAFEEYRGSFPAGDPAVRTNLETTFATYAEIVLSRQLPTSERNDLTTWRTTRDTEIAPLFQQMDRDIATLTAAEDRDAANSAASARSGYETSRTLSIVLLAVGLLLALAVGLYVARSIVRNLSRVQEVCEGLADGDLTRTAQLTSRDEPGRMGRALDAAVERLRRTVSTIDGSATSLSTASEQMAGVSVQIAASAEETSAQAQTVSAAAEQISRSVDTVAAGSEEMGASIREISQNATEAARVASDAVTITAETSTTMSKLGDSSAEIGNVIKVITSIAEQTNLLALNATIEAARAGEAGKGFAVVASEVKDLAQETARATEDISRRVEAIQSDTAGAVSAIEQISQVIARISDFQTTIASAVEEQTATTSEMNRSVAEAATGSGEIAQNITGVAEAARLTSEGVTQSQQATANLSRMSKELSELVSSFRY